jgi:hypothetical protein
MIYFTIFEIKTIAARSLIKGWMGQLHLKLVNDMANLDLFV